LFAGDSEMLGLDTLLEHTKAEELRAAILKLPHHGSLSSFSPALYETVQPSGVVVTGGTRRSGNLGSEIQSWFAQAGLPMWRTRQQGAILTKEYHRNYVVTTVL
jgi:competence protein ComEC